MYPHCCCFSLDWILQSSLSPALQRSDHSDSDVQDAQTQRDAEAPAEAAEDKSRRTNEGTSNWENSWGAAPTRKLLEGVGGAWTWTCRASLTQQIKKPWGRVSVCLQCAVMEGVSQWEEAWWETMWKSWALMRLRICWVWDPPPPNPQSGRSQDPRIRPAYVTANLPPSQLY